MEMDIEIAQWLWHFFIKQWGYNLIGAGIGFFVTIMTRRILLGSAKLSLVGGLSMLGFSYANIVLVPSEYLFTLLGNIGATVGVPDLVTMFAFSVVGGVIGTFYKRAPPIEKRAPIMPIQ